MKEQKASSSAAYFKVFVANNLINPRLSKVTEEERQNIKREFVRQATRMGIQYNLEGFVWSNGSSREKGKEKEDARDEEGATAEEFVRDKEEEVMSIGTRSSKVYSKTIYFDEKSVEHLNMEWSVGEEDAGSKIMAYRADAIKKAAEGKKMPSIQTLILNYVVFFDMSLTIVHDIGMAHRIKVIRKQINRMHSYSPVSDNLSALCYRLLQLALLENDNEDDNDFEQAILENHMEARKEKDEEKKLVLNLLQAQYNKIKALSITTEQSYNDSTLLPLLENVFNNIQGTEHFSTRGRLEELPSKFKLLLPLNSASASRKRRASSSSSSYS